MNRVAHDSFKTLHIRSKHHTFPAGVPAMPIHSLQLFCLSKKNYHRNILKERPLPQVQLRPAGRCLAFTPTYKNSIQSYTAVVATLDFCEKRARWATKS